VEHFLPRVCALPCASYKRPWLRSCISFLHGTDLNPVSCKMRPLTRKARYVFQFFKFFKLHCIVFFGHPNGPGRALLVLRTRKGNKWRHNRLVFFPLTRSLDLARAKMAWKARLAMLCWSFLPENNLSVRVESVPEMPWFCQVRLPLAFYTALHVPTRLIRQEIGSEWWCMM
jgi:hypothetical protein